MSSVDKLKEFSQLLREAVDEIMADYEEDIATANDRRDSRLKEIKDALGDLSPLNAVKDQVINKPRPPRRATGKGEITPAVLEIIKGFGDNSFTRQRVESDFRTQRSDLVEKLNDRTIAMVLYNLEKRGAIEKAREARGKVPARYRRIKQSGPKGLF